MDPVCVCLSIWFWSRDIFTDLCFKNITCLFFLSIYTRGFRGDSKKTPNSWDSLIVSFPYYSHIFGDSCGSGMGLVWPSHQPLFGHSRFALSEDRIILIQWAAIFIILVWQLGSWSPWEIKNDGLKQYSCLVSTIWKKAGWTWGWILG